MIEVTPDHLAELRGMLGQIVKGIEDPISANSLRKVVSELDHWSENKASHSIVAAFLAEMQNR